eukprot:358810-Chlamydomonas_euryale.AAC.8
MRKSTHGGQLSICQTGVMATCVGQRLRSARSRSDSVSAAVCVHARPCSQSEGTCILAIRASRVITYRWSPKVCRRDLALLAGAEPRRQACGHAWHADTDGLKLGRVHGRKTATHPCHSSTCSHLRQHALTHSCHDACMLTHATESHRSVCVSSL